MTGGFPSFQHLRAGAPSGVNVRDRLRRALSDLLAMDPGAIERAALDGHLGRRLTRVRALVFEEVSALRRQGLTPERMLIEMKTTVMPVLAVGRTRYDQYGAADALMSRIVRWCAQAYYGSSTSS